VLHGCVLAHPFLLVVPHGNSTLFLRLGTFNSKVGSVRHLDNHAAAHREKGGWGMREQLYLSQHWKMARRPCRDARTKASGMQRRNTCEAIRGPEKSSKDSTRHATTTHTRTHLPTRHPTLQRRPASAALGCALTQGSSGSSGKCFGELPLTYSFQRVPAGVTREAAQRSP